MREQLSRAEREGLLRAAALAETEQPPRLVCLSPGTVRNLLGAEAELDAERERAEALREPVVALREAHAALIAAVTPPGTVAHPSEEYDALFSRWHAATRACIAALAADDKVRRRMADDRWYPSRTDVRRLLAERDELARERDAERERAEAAERRAAMYRTALMAAGADKAVDLIDAQLAADDEERR